MDYWIKTDISGTYQPVNMDELRRERVAGNRRAALWLCVGAILAGVAFYMLAGWLAGGR